MVIIVTEGQNIFDIALQEYGAVEGYRQLIRDNPAITGPDADLLTGQQLVIDDNLVLQQEVASYLKLNKLRINTGQPALVESALCPAVTNLVATVLSDTEIMLTWDLPPCYEEPVVPAVENLVATPQSDTEILLTWTNPV